MIVARSPEELEPAERAVALGTFDGVHRGHRAVIEAVKATGLRSTVLTFDPHPRLVLGYDVQLLTTFDRRLELIEEIGPDEVLVVEFTQDLSRREPEVFVADYLTAIGARIVVAGEDFRFGAGRRGDVPLLRSLGLEVRAVPMLEGVSSSTDPRARAGRRPPRCGGAPGQAVRARGRGRLRRPTWRHARLSRRPTSRPIRTCSSPRTGSMRARRSGIAWPPRSASIRTTAAASAEIEAFLLDFEGDLYGSCLRLELWERLRGERAFASEEDLVAQIGADVEAARAAKRPG